MLVGVGLALAVGVGLSALGAAQTGPRPAILFDDQHTTGSIVIVDAVRLPDSGFVVVHDPAAAGGESLGPVLGTSVLLGPGEHTTIPVNLQREIDRPTTLIAALYQDANGNGNFDAGHGHGHHDHAGQDQAYRDGNLTIGDRAEVGPPPEPNESSSVDPLVVGGALAVASVALWAVRYR